MNALGSPLRFCELSLLSLSPPLSHFDVRMGVMR